MTMRYHLIPVRMAIIKKSTKINAGEGVEKKEASYTVGENAKWHSQYREQYGDSLKNWKQNCHMTQQSHHWVPYPENTTILKDACTPVFIAAPFTIARTWKQPRCPLTDEWIKK